MGIFDKLRDELIDIIEWTEESTNVLVKRFDRKDNEIKMGAKLIVRPGQKAVFVNEGEIADVYEPGTHTLETNNMPILSTLKGWKYGFQSPFKAEVYFLRVTEQLDVKWGTPNPVIMRDADFGMVRLRCRGNFAYKVGISKDMISRFVGARSEFLREDIEGQIRGKIVSSFSDCLGELKIPTLDLLSKYDEISDAVKTKLAPFFSGLGMEILGFIVENITLPEDVQKAMDQRGSINALGDLNRYSQFKAANALEEAAKNDGMAGNFMGMMVGNQLGGSLGNVLNQNQNQNQNQNTVSNTPQIQCSKCNTTNSQGTKFCASCGNPMTTGTANCVKCAKPIKENAKFCPECGSPQTAQCSKCGVELKPGSKFCPECGTPQ